MKKKFLYLIFLLIIGNNILAVEIIPEYYLMERLLLTIEKSYIYVNESNGMEVRAIQIDDNISKKLNNGENPFYVYDSTTEQKLVRKGDYFISPLRLSSIYVIEKENFENNYTTKNNFYQNLKANKENKDNIESDVSDVKTRELESKEVKK